jgi:Trk-type K+ transport system membrane component
MIAAYLAPWVIAKVRDHHNSLAIFWLTLLLGWTGIFWIASLIWSLTAARRSA